MRTSYDRNDRKEHFDGQNLRERSRKAMLRRRGQLRAKVILLNSAVALIVIMIVLVCKVISLNSKDSIDSLQMADNKSQQGKQNQVQQKKGSKTPEANAATSASIATTPAPVNGPDQWIRKNLDASKPMVALTFDDGPYTPVTKRILATLKKYDERATFFCVGSRVDQYAQMVQQEYAQGCQVASHTYGHVNLTKLKKKKIKKEINKANAVLQKTIGCPSTVLRPTGGLINAKVCSAVGEPMVCWSIDSEDWKSRNKKKILKKCKHVRDGDIVLMHDLYPATAAAVEKLVPSLKKQGFLLVTVDELFYYKGIQTKAGAVYYSGR